MSTMIQPNGTPGRSPRPGRSGMAAGERAEMEWVKAEAHAAYMAAYREALRALAAEDIGRSEYDRRLAEAGSARHRAAHDAALRIEAARHPAEAVFAWAA